MNKSPNPYPRTICPDGYQSPDDAEIEQMLKKAEFKGTVSLDFIRDAAHIAAGGEFTDQSLWFAETDMDRVFKEVSASVQAFLKAIDFNKIDGATPLEKAVKLVLSTQEGERGDKGVLPFMPKPQRSAEKAMELLEAMRDFSDFEREMLDIGQGDLKDIARLNDRKSRALASLSAKLKKVMKFKARRKVSFVPTPTGDIKRQVMMTEYGQLAAVKPVSQLVMPDFKYKFATKQLRVVQKVKVKEEKQLLFLLVDQSESMNVPERIGYSLAVVLNRLDAVAKGEAELYVSLFDHRMTEPRLVKSIEEARDLFNRFRHFNPKGGGTRIDGALKEAVKFIKSQHKSFEPQIAIVTDGDDSVWTRKDEMGNIVLNYVAIQSFNDNLKTLCNATGGAFIHCE